MSNENQNTGSLITSLLINTYRTTLFPENREYQMISYNAIKASLVGLNQLPAGIASKRIIAAVAGA